MNIMLKTNLKIRFNIFILSLAVLSIYTAEAQVLKINTKTSTMTIHGTTNVHGFETKVTQINGELIVNNAKQVQSMTVTIPVKSIKSKEKLMDTKTYEAFDADKNPTISFRFIEATSLKITGQDIEVIVTGNLTMAGITRKISFKTIGKHLKTNVFEFKGSIPLKMTDFKMKPPTAMLGVMKVGDAVTLKYNVFLEGNTDLSSLLEK